MREEHNTLLENAHEYTVMEGRALLVNQEDGSSWWVKGGDTITFHHAVRIPWWLRWLIKVETTATRTS